MAGNTPPVPQLQRRGGRRVSLQASPTAERSFSDLVPQLSSNGAPESVAEAGIHGQAVDAMPPSQGFPPSAHSSASRERFQTPGQSSPADHWSPRSAVGEATTSSPQVNSSASDYGHQALSKGNHSETPIRSSPLSTGQRDVLYSTRPTDGKYRAHERAANAGKSGTTVPIPGYDRAIGDDGSSRVSATKKSRLNLLNPMSLLARRRSSQNTRLEEVNVAPLHVPAIPDFDPSIRGNIVHDFSAPRLRTPRRELGPASSPAHSHDHGNTHLPNASSPVLHSPMFKEHFHEDDVVLQPGQTAYLHNLPLEPPPVDSLPPFAQKLPSTLSMHNDRQRPSPEVGANVDIDLPTRPPPPPPKSTPPPVPDSNIPAHLPKHMKSTSSRFSFQISGHGSAAQERLLEERHRERFPEELEDIADGGEDEYDDLDFDADNGWEEEIPGINADRDDDDQGDEDFAVDALPRRQPDTSAEPVGFYEEDDLFANDDIVVRNIELPTSQTHSPMPLPLDDTVRQNALLGFHFTPRSTTWTQSPTSTQHGSEPTPRDSQGFPIGVADTKDSPRGRRAHTSFVDEDREESQLHLEGLRISTGEGDHHRHHHNTFVPSADAFDDADLYFDDGDLGTEIVDADTRFDEELLDDETHLRDLPAENARRYEEALRRQATADSTRLLPSTTIHGTDRAREPEAGAPDQHPGPTTGTLLPRGITLSATVPSLTEGNLAAYHDALAMAATNAASEGRFDRQVSFSEKPEATDDPLWSSSPSGLVSDESRYSLNMGMGTFPDDDSFVFDDDADLDDDLMIAEANADALENDDDGFYGQEFGFYARAYGKEQPELLHGGYFTTRGSNGVKRSHSGKANFQEPSLTPITERSEWSARNSVVSLQFHPGLPLPGQSLPSPGLTQLMDSPAIEDELSLSALIKLRRGAFGGSSTSINSLGDRSVPNSSPLAHVSNYKFPPLDPKANRVALSHQPLPGARSIPESEEEEDGEDADRPTMTQNTPRRGTVELPPRTPERNSIHLDVETPVTSRKGHHSRNSSGAESVSYARDDDGRWILERRRTGDDGELELVAREYLAGARI